jgi:hydrogenase expression/formation protein HypD
MKFVDEYRDPAAVSAVADRIARSVSRPWTIMEVCGGQTHAIVRHGLDELLPDGVQLIHGPGCPVCVTPAEVLDLAHRIAARPEVVFCTFADMLRVPGSMTDLYAVKAAGGDVRAVLSPLDALAVAEREPAREVVFFAVGFETTAPATALALAQARQRGLRNFSALVTHVRVPPALAAILTQPGNRVQGFLAAGHVCAVMGTMEYDGIARAFGVPIVVTGFEPIDILDGIARCIAQLEAGRAQVENAYPRAVQRGGNVHAQALMTEVFEVGERHWRGLGAIAASGLVLRSDYARFDAELRFGSPEPPADEAGPCISGAILTGQRRPTDCPAFGTRCTPEHPLGATMVSGEGACAAYYRYRPAGPA